MHIHIIKYSPKEENKWVSGTGFDAKGKNANDKHKVGHILAQFEP